MLFAKTRVRIAGLRLEFARACAAHICSTPAGAVDSLRFGYGVTYPALRERKGHDEKRRAMPDPMHPEYDLDYSKGVRGKYYRLLLREGANVAVLDPDVAQAFRSSAAVNEALRSLLEVSEAARRLKSRSGGRASRARR